MTPEERDRMGYLCKQIEVETDPETFDRIVNELNDLLELEHDRVHPEPTTKVNY
jgi:hypothetical protein